MSTGYKIGEEQKISPKARFFLENMAARTMGMKLPPYWLYRKDLLRVVPSESYVPGDPVDVSRVDGYEAVQRMSDAALVDMVRTNALGLAMQAPLSFYVNGEEWLLPFEPVINVKGKNVLTMRSVCKSSGERSLRGSVKERWAQDDYSVEIEGILMGLDGRYPMDDVLRLRKVCEGAAVEVRSPLLDLFGITRLVIEEYEFAHTAGVANQEYSISAVSDDAHELLLTEDMAALSAGASFELPDIEAEIIRGERLQDFEEFSFELPDDLVAEDRRDEFLEYVENLKIDIPNDELPEYIEPEPEKE